MPNPFMRTGVPNRSHKPTDRPEPIAPVMEEIAEPNFAYRGIEDHGVPVHGDTFTDVPGYGATVDALYEIEPEPPHVVPVRIVNDDTGKIQLKSFRTLQMGIGTEPVRILGRDLTRTKLSLKPFGGGQYAVFMARSRSDVQTSMSAWVLSDASANEFAMQDEIWVMASNSLPAMQTVPLYVYEEFTVDM